MGADRTSAFRSRLVAFARWYLVAVLGLFLLGIVASRFAICWSLLVSLVLAMPVAVLVQRLAVPR